MRFRRCSSSNLIMFYTTYVSTVILRLIVGSTGGCQNRHRFFENQDLIFWSSDLVTRPSEELLFFSSLEVVEEFFLRLHSYPPLGHSLVFPRRILRLLVGPGATIVAKWPRQTTDRDLCGFTIRSDLSMYRSLKFNNPLKPANFAVKSLFRYYVRS
jgi:hypothetical protein